MNKGSERAEALPYLRNEEAIKRCKQTLRFQEELNLVVWERARIELVYIRNLREWIATIRTKLKAHLDQPKDSTDDIVIANLVREADCTAEIHQNIHNLIMSPEGPYSSLQRGIGLNKINPRNLEEKLLSDIEKQFHINNKKRLAMELDLHKRRVNIEKMKSCTIEIEEQLSKRSRIATNRRNSRSNKKTEHLNNRLSMFRKQIGAEKDVVLRKEEQLMEFLKGTKEVMQNLYNDLTDHQKLRLALIYEQLENFSVTFRGVDQGLHKRKSEIREMSIAFNSINIDEIMERFKKHVETRATSRKIGRVFDLQDIFSPIRMSQKGKNDVCHSTSTLPTESNDYRDPTPATKSAIVMGRFQYGNADNSESDNLLVDTFCASSSESLRRQRMNPPLLSDSSDSSLGSGIETINIPSEPVTNLKMPPPFPTKGFCTGESGGRNSPSKKEKHVEFADQVEDTARWSSTCEYNSPSDEDDVSMTRNIRVVAMHDFVARKRDQISFRKGQIIKQKIPENEDGFAYGWVRENRLTPKQYGWFPAGIVQRYQPLERSSSRGEMI